MGARRGGGMELAWRPESGGRVASPAARHGRRLRPVRPRPMQHHLMHGGVDSSRLAARSGRALRVSASPKSRLTSPPKLRGGDAYARAVYLVPQPRRLPLAVPQGGQPRRLPDLLHTRAGARWGQLPLVDAVQRHGPTAVGVVTPQPHDRGVSAPCSGRAAAVGGGGRPPGPRPVTLCSQRRRARGGGAAGEEG
jgi:hypothetical protein